jgi:hypothetical protein
VPLAEVRKPMPDGLSSFGRTCHYKSSRWGDQPRQTILELRERRPLARTNSRDARRK